MHSAVGDVVLMNISRETNYFRDFCPVYKIKVFCLSTTLACSQHGLLMFRYKKGFYKKKECNHHVLQFVVNDYLFRIILYIRWPYTSLFSLKGRNIHPSNVIYEGNFEACQVSYIGETGRNFSVRKQENEDKIVVKTEPARHLYANPGHSFPRRILGTRKM